MSTDIQPDEIDWRVGATYDGRDGKMGMLLGYIDARLAMEKLDALDANWSSRMEPFRLGDKDGVRCSLTVNGVTREDVGTASDTEPLKGAVSDALKRAAVHFGIGRELYDLPSIAVQCEVKSNGKVGRPKAMPVWKNGKWTIDPKLGWVRYDHEPNEQTGRGAKTKPGSGPVPAPTGPSLDQIKSRLLDVAAEHHIGAAALDLLIKERIAEGATAEEVRAGLIELGTNIGRGKHDGGVPPEQMSTEEAIAAGAALVGKT